MEKLLGALIAHRTNEKRSVLDRPVGNLLLEVFCILVVAGGAFLLQAWLLESLCGNSEAVGCCLLYLVGATPLAAIYFLPKLSCWRRWFEPATEPSLCFCALFFSVSLSIFYAAVCAMALKEKARADYFESIEERRWGPLPGTTRKMYLPGPKRIGD